MTTSHLPRLRVAGFLSLLGLSACVLFQGQRAGEPVNDRDIAAIFLAANNTDVSYAQVALAPGRTTNTEIVTFANRMLSDHGGLNKAALDLYSASGITPRDNSISLDFRDESAAKRDTLREFTGATFDSAYMVNEVRYHRRLLVALDSVLIPAARNADLKGMLTRVRPAVAAHLEHAERVQAGLRK
jgi:putative membrane protein